MSEEKFYELERLHDKIYEETQEYGRTQFVSRIADLQQENQQLKEKYLNAVADYETTKSENQQLKEDYNCAFQDAEELNQRLKEVIDERNNLLSVLDEIREYSLDLHLYDNESLEFKISNDLLQILDKVGSND